MVHQNICDHADDLRSLYKLWDDDLRLMMRKRQIAELIGSAALLLSLWAWETGIAPYLLKLGILFAVISL